MAEATAVPMKTCRAKGCELAIPPTRLMCATHWRLVPYSLKRAVLDAMSPAERVGAALAAIRSVDGVTTDGRFRRG